MSDVPGAGIRGVCESAAIQLKRICKIRHMRLRPRLIALAELLYLVRDDYSEGLQQDTDQHNILDMAEVDSEGCDRRHFKLLAIFTFTQKMRELLI